MNAFDDMMARGMDAMTDVAGEAIEIDGKPLRGVVNRFQLTRTMQDAGYDPGYNFSAVFPVSQMAELPPFDQRPVFGLYKGRKVQVRDGDVDEAGVRLYLQEVA